MAKTLEMKDIARELITVLAKHQVPIYMIDEVFDFTRKSVDSQAVRNFGETNEQASESQAGIPPLESMNLMIHVSVTEKLDPHTLAQTVRDQMTQAFESAARRFKGGGV